MEEKYFGCPLSQFSCQAATVRHTSERVSPAYFKIHIWPNIATGETIIVHRERSDLSKLSVLIEYYVSRGWENILIAEKYQLLIYRRKNDSLCADYSQSVMD